MESRPQIRGNPQTDFARKAQIRQPNPANLNTAKRPITLAAQDLGGSSQTTSYCLSFNSSNNSVSVPTIIMAAIRRRVFSQRMDEKHASE
jgi:hypothetical protein